MSHTPGPWNLQEFSAQTYMISTFQNGLIAQHVPGEANARLIAAAPEMYEALERLIKSLLSNDTDCQATLQEVLRGQAILERLKEDAPK